MYDRRVKVFIGLNLAMVLACVLRLAQMQWLPDSSIQSEIDRLKQQRLRSTLLKTIRGRILDRNGRVLAEDIPQFQVTISYKLSSYADKRILITRVHQAQEKSANPSLVDLLNEISAKEDELEQIKNACAQLGAKPALGSDFGREPQSSEARARREDIDAQIKETNDRLWDLRTFIAWARSEPDPNLLAKYDNRKETVPQDEAFPDFERQFPDPNVRYKRIVKVDDIPEMKTRFPLVELKTDDDIFAAQMEFRDMDVNDVQVAPLGNRFYPYGSAAAQTIGWVGAATVPKDKELFENDPLARYLEEGDVCGREDGVEYVCEAVLRGRRGEEVSDIDKSLVRETQPEFGQDVQITVDIELQKQIEQYVTDPEKNLNYDANTAVVVLDIRTGDILAMVSLPSCDLNRVRYDYGELRLSPGHPLINRAINALYPPGSVVKPLILAAGLETRAIRPDEPISCRAAPAPPGWPDCSIWREHHGAHDNLWTNDARHAIQGSCNIYFSHLADRLDPKLLQQWLFKFGYGHQILGKFDCRSLMEDVEIKNQPSTIRLLKESAGQLGSTNVPDRAQITSLAQIPRLNDAERRYFGIGQGNLRVTPLQVANAFAALARGGQYKPPRLFKSEIEDGPVDLGISPANLQVIYDGMSAVVNEPHGTAHEAFYLMANNHADDRAKRGIKVYGKTGSTEGAVHAWFAGFAEDPTGARIAIAVVVEGGEHGGTDAAPIGRDVIQLCAEAGYVGK